MDDDQNRSVPERLLWLFEVVLAPAARDAARVEAESQWRPYTTAELVGALNSELDIQDTRASYALLERLRRGERPDARTLNAVARFFGTPTGYFSDDPAEIADAQDILLERALRDSEVTTLLLCRGAALTPAARRTRLRRVLEIIRPARIPAGRFKVDIVNPPSPSPTTWQHRERPAPEFVSASPERSPTHSEEVRTVSPLTTAELRELCLRMLSELDIVPPLTPALLCERLGESRGRPIKLVAAEVFTTASVGHLICKRRRDLIVYQRDAPPTQQSQVIYHEVVHLIRDHLDGQETLSCGGSEDDSAGLYAAWQEWEAETGATILSELARRPSHPRWVPRSTAAHESGLAVTFGLTRGDCR